MPLFSPSLVGALGALAVVAGLAGANLPPPPAAGEAEAMPVGAPRYDTDGRLLPPTDYRQWVFLSSGLDMSYSDPPTPAGAHVFDNVFAPPAAYAAFQRDGVWPDKTVLVLEIRAGASKGSINHRGAFQAGEVTGVETHVKDAARFKGGWAFFGFDGALSGPSKQIPFAAACYACHQAHAAADTTFVQFYPTLLPVATRLKTLSAGYLSDPEPVAAAK